MNVQMSNVLKQGDNTPVVLNGANNEVRITSIELVEMINAFRKEEGNETEKRHSDLMTSIKTELDVLETAGINQRNFSPVTYKDKKGEIRPCYLLNKESAVVRYRTVQFIEALEQKVKEKQQPQSMSMEDIIIYQMQQSKMMKEQLEQTQTVAIEAKTTAEQ